MNKKLRKLDFFQTCLRFSKFYELCSGTERSTCGIRFFLIATPAGIFTIYQKRWKFVWKLSKLLHSARMWRIWVLFIFFANSSIFEKYPILGSISLKIQGLSAKITIVQAENTKFFEKTGAGGLSSHLRVLCKEETDIKALGSILQHVSSKAH